jgi:hypothetical protein
VDLIAEKRTEIDDLKVRIGTLHTELSTLELAAKLRPAPSAAPAPPPPAPPPAAPPPLVEAQAHPPPIEPEPPTETGGDPLQARKGRLFG